MVSSGKLLKCTLKKSVYVGIVWTFVIVMGTIGALLAVFLTPVAFSGITHVFDITISALASVPWWIWMVVAYIAVIFLYSLSWCIKRELPEGAMQDGRLDQTIFLWYGIGIMIAAIVALGIRTCDVSVIGGLMSVPEFATLIFVTSIGILGTLAYLDVLNRKVTVFRPLFAYYYVKKDERAAASASTTQGEP